MTYLWLPKRGGEKGGGGFERVETIFKGGSCTNCACYEYYSSLYC